MTIASSTPAAQRDHGGSLFLGTVLGVLLASLLIVATSGWQLWQQRAEVEAIVIDPLQLSTPAEATSYPHYQTKPPSNYVPPAMPAPSYGSPQEPQPVVPAASASPVPASASVPYAGPPGNVSPDVPSQATNPLAPPAEDD